MAYVNRTPIELVAERVSNLTFADMMNVAQMLRDELIGNIETIDGIPSLDSVSVAHVLSEFAENVNSEYLIRSKEAA